MKQYSSKLLHERIQKECPTLFNTLCNLTNTTIPEVEPADNGDEDKDEGDEGKETEHTKTPKKDPYFVSIHIWL